MGAESFRAVGWAPIYFLTGLGAAWLRTRSARLGQCWRGRNPLTPTPRERKKRLVSAESGCRCVWC